MLRAAVAFAFVAILAGQSPAPPLAVSKIRTVTDGYFGTTAVLGPNGDLYLFSSSGGSPAPSKSFGDTSRRANIVWRYDPTGKLVYVVALGATYLIDLKADAAGNAYVSGSAPPTGLYTTPGAYRSTGAADYSQFVCKLRPTDGEPQYCTYLDVEGFCPGIGADASGNFYVLCGAVSHGRATPGALNLGKNTYVAKLDPAGSKLVFGALVGGSYVDYAGPAILDAAGNVTITGFTYSPDFPTTPKAVVRSFQYSASEPFVSFVTKLNATGTALVYSTLGKGSETPMEIALDPSGNAQVLFTDGSYNLRVRRYNADGSAVQLETSPNLPPLEYGFGAHPLMAVDSSGTTTLVGYVDEANFQTVQPTQTCQFALGGTGYMARLSDSGSVLQATFLQGSDARISFVGLSVTPGAASVAVKSGWPPRGEILTLSPNANAQVKLACAGNAASLLGNAIAPGEILSLFGEGIGPVTPQSAQLGVDQRFPTSLAGTQVTFDGIPAPLLYVSDKQINTVSPFKLASTTQICVVFGGAKTNCLTASVRSADPGIFLAGPPNFSVRGKLATYAAAVNQDGTPNSAENPAAVGSIVSLYATGLGSITPAVPDGSLIPIPIPVQNLRLVVEVPNSDMHSPDPGFAQVLYAGPAPLAIAGLSQINVRVPSLYGGWFTLRVLSPDGKVVARSNSANVWTKAN